MLSISRHARTFPALFLFNRNDHAACLYSETNIAEKESYFTVDQTVFTKIRALLGYLETDIK